MHPTPAFGAALSFSNEPNLIDEAHNLILTPIRLKRGDSGENPDSTAHTISCKVGKIKRCNDLEEEKVHP